MNILRKDRALLIELSEKYSGEKPNQIPNIDVGAVASGSAVLADRETAETIRKQHRKLLGVDMELYGVASAARDSGLPKPLAFGLKTVCDFADHLMNDKYQKYCSYMSAQVLRVFMERYAHELFSTISACSINEARRIVLLVRPPSALPEAIAWPSKPAGSHPPAVQAMVEKPIMN